jgi:hypothetical protein
MQPENVVIEKSGDEYIGVSAVDDYKYRPLVDEDVSLYDWIRLATKSKRSKRRKKTVDVKYNNEGVNWKKEVDMDPVVDSLRRSTRSQKIGQTMVDSLEYESRRAHANFDGVSWAADTDCDESSDESATVYDDHSFLSDHPQSDTHQVHVEKDNELIVPNFVGGVLPRSDCGDREYYCCTMLTLFKPWRSGKDLKHNNQTWDESFLEHKFTKRQLEFIKYFNLRYECLDARDDYSARRKKGENVSIFPQWSSDDLMNDLDDSMDQDQHDPILDAEYDEHQAQGDFERIGEEGQKVIEQMMEIESVVNNVGWLHKCVDGIPDVGLEPVRVPHG